MAITRFAWGIDIGNRALKAIRLVRDGDGLRVDDFELIEHEQVLSNAGDNRQSLIETALANFVQRHPQKGGVAAISVSGQTSFARFIKLPPVEPKKIPEIVRFEAIQQIPFPLDEVEWSYQLFQSPDSPDVEVGIFAMRKDLVNQQIKYFTDVDLNVQTVQMSPLAVYNAMAYDGRLPETTMIVDLGAENTDLIIADNESVWLRSIPIGGNNFTEALVKSFKLNFAKAEELKRNAATSKYARQIFQAMRPVFADLVAEIQRSIGFYASVHRDSRIGKIIALGGTFRLPGLQKYLQQNLQTEVERLNTFAAGAPADGKLATAFNENLLSMATAYGLAIQAMGEAKITSSLLPQHIRRARIWQEKTKWFGAAAALFVVGTGVGLGSVSLHRLALTQSEQTHRPQISSVLSQAEDLDRQWSEIESAGAPDRAQINNVRSLSQYRTLQAQLITDIYAATPKLNTIDPEQVKQIPRGQRAMILIDSLRPRYSADLSQVLAATDADFRRFAAEGAALPIAPTPSPEMMGPPEGFPGGPPPMDMGEGAALPASAAGGQRGFLITVRGVTPNRDGVEFIDRAFVKALAAIQQNDKRPYAVARASIIAANQIKQDPARLSALTAAYNAAKATGQIPDTGSPAGVLPPGGAALPPGFGGAAATPAAADNIEPFLERSTREDVRDDWAFTVLFAVVIEPPPKTPAGPG